MKKMISLLVFILAIGGMLQAQSMKFADTGQDTVKLPANHNEFLEVPFRIVNLSSDTLQVTAARVLNDTASGHGTFFCWDICYGFETNESISFIEIAPGDTTVQTYIDFEANGVNGVTTATMEFTNVANRETISRTYTFQVGELTNIDRQLSTSEFSLPYPNPTSSQFFVDIQLPKISAESELILYNMQGQQVLKQVVNPAQIQQQIWVDDLDAGTYFLHLRTQESIQASRTVIIR